ncbi:ATP F0F1 synthase subunit delta [Campylobacter sp. MIT 99-7217]|uniref:F0F1 ATP synthase subunit delta n=1 Tax=Campylobacter sp. MIT 99-7217 TaxID=535091 RepID=UPI00115946A6|nr:F0F1 ATP synthase subunit delta [Campylobacter sp. MIT 99-7217]TQR30326.1 ATP F0F1 synthase subunit delta [Campylobacter sp. MIT 99-7217]
MNDLIAKRYAKAILQRKDSDLFYENLRIVAEAFSLPKFKSFISSYEIKKEEKIKLILSFFEKIDVKFENLIKILAYNLRLDLIPQITEELAKQKALKEGTFVGFVYAKTSIKAHKINELAQKQASEDKLAKLEEGLGQRFGVKIRLEERQSDNDGVKISLDDLGYEISFSLQSLEDKMSEYILKAI